MNIIEQIKRNKKIIYNGAIYYQITKHTLLSYAKELQNYRIITFDKKHIYPQNSFYINFEEV